MSPQQAGRTATIIGWVSLAAGAALAVAPGRSGRLMRLGERGTDLRLVGLGDLAVGGGLLLARPRWPWMIARIAVNTAAGGLMVRLARRERAPGARVFAAFLAAVSIPDSRVMLALRAERA